MRKQRPSDSRTSLTGKGSVTPQPRRSPLDFVTLQDIAGPRDGAEAETAAFLAFALRNRTPAGFAAAARSHHTASAGQLPPLPASPPRVLRVGQRQPIDQQSTVVALPAIATNIYADATEKLVLDLAKKYPFHESFRPLSLQLGPLRPIALLQQEIEETEEKLRHAISDRRDDELMAMFEIACAERSKFVMGQLQCDLEVAEKSRFALRVLRFQEEGETVARRAIEQEALRIHAAIRRCHRRQQASLEALLEQRRRDRETLSDAADQFLRERQEWVQQQYSRFLSPITGIPRHLVAFEELARTIGIEKDENKQRTALVLRCRDEAASLEVAIDKFKFEWLRQHAKELETQHLNGRVEISEDLERLDRNAIRTWNTTEQRNIREQILIPRKLVEIVATEDKVRQLREPVALTVHHRFCVEALFTLFTNTRTCVAVETRQAYLTEKDATTAADSVVTVLVKELVALSAHRATHADAATMVSLFSPAPPSYSPQGLSSSLVTSPSAGLKSTAPKVGGKTVVAQPTPDALLSSTRVAAAVTVDGDMAALQLRALPLHEAAWRQDILRQCVSELAEVLLSRGALLRHVSSTASYQRAAQAVLTTNTTSLRRSETMALSFFFRPPPSLRAKRMDGGEGHVLPLESDDTAAPPVTFDEAEFVQVTSMPDFDDGAISPASRPCSSASTSVRSVDEDVVRDLREWLHAMLECHSAAPMLPASFTSRHSRLPAARATPLDDGLFAAEQFRPSQRRGQDGDRVASPSAMTVHDVVGGDIEMVPLWDEASRINALANIDTPTSNHRSPAAASRQGMRTLTTAERESRRSVVFSRGQTRRPPTSQRPISEGGGGDSSSTATSMPPSRGTLD